MFDIINHVSIVSFYEHEVRVVCKTCIIVILGEMLGFWMVLFYNFAIVGQKGLSWVWSDYGTTWLLTCSHTAYIKVMFM